MGKDMTDAFQVYDTCSGQGEQTTAVMRNYFGSPLVYMA